MAKYRIKVTFVLEVEAETADDAEDIGYGWLPKHPQDDSYEGTKWVSAETSNVLEEGKP
jgi:hypothetical protein